MAYTLNTGHALYGNLIELIGVQGGALVSHKTARTFTLGSSPAPSFGTGGTFGEYFHTAYATTASPSGASFTPALTTDGTSHGVTMFYAINNADDTLGDSGAHISGSTTSSYRIPGVAITAAGKAVATYGPDGYLTPGSTTVLNNGAHSFATTRQAGAQSSSSATLYVDGALETTGGSGVNEIDTSREIDYIGGMPGFTSLPHEFVWLAYFDRELTAGEILSLHNSLGASNAFGLVSSGDSTAPTLTSASVTSVGTTTGTGNVTTDEGNGTLYSVVSTSATAPSAAQIQAGQNHTGAAAVWSGNQAVSSTGAKTFSITGLTASTAYYAHFQHKDAANNNSTVVTSAQFTTGSTDTTVPTLTGSVTISGKTTTSYTATLPAGSDNIAVTGYEYRLNAGSWVDNGNTQVINISARTPGSTDTLEARAYDAAGNKSTPALSVSVTLLIGTITLTDVTQWETNVAKPSETGITVDVSTISTGALLVRKTGQVTTAGSDMAIKDAAIADATVYQVVVRFADGSIGICDCPSSLT